VWDRSLNRKVAVGTFPSKATARTAERTAEQELCLSGVVSERKDTTYGQLCDAYLATTTNLASSTRAWYANALKASRSFFGEAASVRRLTKADVQAFAAHLMSLDRSANTVRSYVKMVSALMGYAIEANYRQDNPALKLRNLPKRRRLKGAVRAISPEDHEKLVACVQTLFRQGRGAQRYRGYKVMISVMPFIGLRRSEVQGLTWEHVDLDAKQLRVERQLRPDGTLDPTLKTDKSRRVVRLPDRVVRELWAWRVECPPNALDLVFPTYRGLPQNEAQFYRVWNKATSAAGLDGLDPHDLRHTYATWNLAAGVNPKWASEQMGHEKPSMMLDVYAHLLPSADEEAAQKVELWHDKQRNSGRLPQVFPTEAVAGL
jgi:integrase